MNPNFEALRAVFNEAEENATKHFEKGNKAAGTRLRKNMSELKNLALVIRKDVIENINAQKES